MKLLITGDQLRRRVSGGIGTYIRGLLQGLRAVPTVEPTLWSGRFPPAIQVRLWDRGWGVAPRNYDLVHASSLAIPPKKATPMSVMVHDVAWRSHPGAYPEHGRRWHEEALSRAIARADALATPSPDVAAQLVAEGVAADRVYVISLGCDHLAAPDLPAAKQRLENHGVGGEFLLAVGTMEPRKNLPRLIEAYQQIRSQLPEPWPLVIVGPTGWGEEIVPVDGVVLVHGASDAEISAFYQLCRVLAYVPLLEGFGFPAVEAMLMGAPVVASRVPSIGDAGLQIDPTDVDEIAQGLLRAATDMQSRQDLIKQGNQHARSLTWEASAHAHASMWESLL